MKLLNVDINGLKSKYNKLVNYVKNENFDLIRGVFGKYVQKCCKISLRQPIDMKFRTNKHWSFCN